MPTRSERRIQPKINLRKNQCGRERNKKLSNKIEFHYLLDIPMLDIKSKVEKISLNLKIMCRRAGAGHYGLTMLVRKRSNSEPIHASEMSVNQDD